LILFDSIISVVLTKIKYLKIIFVLLLKVKFYVVSFLHSNLLIIFIKYGLTQIELYKTNLLSLSRLKVKFS